MHVQMSITLDNRVTLVCTPSLHYPMAMVQGLGRLDVVQLFRLQIGDDKRGIGPKGWCVAQKENQKDGKR